jgi:hypothetical protein
MTLKTCTLTEKEYSDAVNSKTEPMLFTTKSFGPGAGMPQNYYIITEKYEILEGKEWEDTISNSPGVYYYLTVEEGKSKKDYVDDKGFLLTSYANTQYLKPENDIFIEEGKLYFRKIVELILSSAENVVNIADAKQITVDALPANLYQKISGEEEGYRSVSALSDIFVNKDSYGDITGLCTIIPVLLEIGY